MRTTTIVRIIVLSLLVALCTMGCKHKSVEDITTSDSSQRREPPFSPTVVDTNVTKEIADVRHVTQVTNLEAKYNEAKGYLEYKFKDKPKALKTEMIALDNAYFDRFVELAHDDLSDGSGWCSPKYKAIKTLYHEFGNKYGENLSNTLWLEIDEAFTDYNRMWSQQNLLKEHYRKRPRNVSDTWSNCEYLISFNPRKNVTSLARTSPVYDSLSDNYVRRNLCNAHYHFVTRLVTLAENEYRKYDNPCDAEWVKIYQHVAKEMGRYEDACNDLYHNTARLEKAKKEFSELSRCSEQ